MCYATISSTIGYGLQSDVLSIMGFYGTLYLTHDKATQYLKEAGVSPFELYTLKPQMVNGAQRIPLMTYCFANVMILAKKHSRLNKLPALEKFMSKFQRSRHKEMLIDTDLDEAFRQHQDLF